MAQKSLVRPSGIFPVTPWLFVHLFTHVRNIGCTVFCTLTDASCSTLLSDKWIGTTTPVVRGFMEEVCSTRRISNSTPLMLSACADCVSGRQRRACDRSCVPDSAITFVEEITFLEHAEHPQRGTVPVSKQHFKSRMLVDLEAGRSMEVEEVVRGVVRKGREAGIPVPRYPAFLLFLLCFSVHHSPLVIKWCLIHSISMTGWKRHMRLCRLYRNRSCLNPGTYHGHKHRADVLLPNFIAVERISHCTVSSLGPAEKNI